MNGIKVLLQALNRVRIQGYQYIWANVAFVVLSLPLVTMPAAWRALIIVGHYARVHPHEADLALFWDSFKESLPLTWKWGLVFAIFGGIHFSNWRFFSTLSNYPISVLLSIVWWAITFVWLGITCYTWTIYEEMETASVLLATQNALIMVLQNPFFTVTILIGISVLMLISTVLLVPWVLLTWGTISAILNEAVHNRLSEYRIQVKNRHAIN